jgi:hypothetical protein
MHRDPGGLLHANVFVFGAWSAALGYVLDWLARAPATFQPMIRTIDRPPADPEAWFRLVDLVLPADARRDEPLGLHVAAISGTLCSEGIQRHLFACADAILFVADTWADDLHRSGYARDDLDAWIAARGDDAIVAFLFDRAGYGESTVLADPPSMCERLRTGTHAWFPTSTRTQEGLQAPMRHLVAALLAARDRLVARSPFA